MDIVPRAEPHESSGHSITVNYEAGGTGVTEVKVKVGHLPYFSQSTSAEQPGRHLHRKKINRKNKCKKNHLYEFFASNPSSPESMTPTPNAGCESNFFPPSVGCKIWNETGEDHGWC